MADALEIEESGPRKSVCLFAPETLYNLQNLIRSRNVITNIQRNVLNNACIIIMFCIRFQDNPPTRCDYDEFDDTGVSYCLRSALQLISSGHQHLLSSAAYITLCCRKVFRGELLQPIAT